MLLDRYRQLLTAFVDGELNNRQRRHVARLLRRSEEARQLLEQLREDAEALRCLPPPPAPADLTEPILRKIAERGLAPNKLLQTKTGTISFWTGSLGAFASAAAILLALGFASYWYFAATLARSDKPEIVQKAPEATRSAAQPDQPQPLAVAKGPGPATSATGKAPVKTNTGRRMMPMRVVQHPGDTPKGPPPDKEPAPPKNEDAVLTERLEMFRYSKVEAVLPVVLRVRELDQEAVRRKLTSELGKEKNFRLELPCHNGTRALERVQAAAKTMDLGLLIEKNAQARLKLPTMKTNFVVYLENVTPEELAHLVRQIGIEDDKITGGKPADRQFDRLVLTRMTPQHHKELATLIGIDPTETAPSAEAKGPLGTDPHKPLSDLTAQQVGKALAGQGGAPRSEAGKPPRLLGLVLAYNPVRPHPGSPEIKRFLDSRKPAKQGTIRVLLVLRS